nr:hypothetical protein [Haliscomenobacter sp.]
MITTAKSMGAGMPIAALIGKAEIMDSPHPGGIGEPTAAARCLCSGH